MESEYIQQHLHKTLNKLSAVVFETTKKQIISTTWLRALKNCHSLILINICYTKKTDMPSFSIKWMKLIRNKMIDFIIFQVLYIGTSKKLTIC